MKNYFQLQYKMLNRHFIDFGIIPIIAYPLIFIGFVFGSLVFLGRFEMAVYMYLFWSVSLLLKLSTKNRNDFLKGSFSAKRYIKIRILENAMLILPFLIVLLYKQAFLSSLFLFIIAAGLSLVKINTSTNFTIPTPFKKYPFEFTEGFRKTFFIFPLAYFLLFMGVKVHNFNLAVFSLLIIFGISISYFSKTEVSYHVWMFKLSPKEFLHMKIKTALIYVSVLTLPMLVVLGVFFTKHIVVFTGFQCMGYVYLALIIVAKYSVFPKQINLPVSVIYAISFLFPPFVFFNFWHFYKKAIEQLNTVLHDEN